MSKERARELFLGLSVLFITSYAWMFSKVSVPNERTRAYLTVAIVDHGSLAIDEPIKRFGAVYDLAAFGGHYYTDKAPGSSLLGVPIYAAVRLFTAAQDWDIVGISNLLRTYLMLPFGLLGFLLLRWLLGRLGVSESARDLAALGFSLGSPVLHYSNAFYGHVLVATLVLACLCCLARAGVLGPEAHGGRRWLLAAGGCAGLAGLVEYQAIALAALLGIPLCFAPRRQIARNVASYVAGALPFAAALLWYDARAFGGPFELSYQHLVGSSLQELHGFGLAGATIPTREALHAMATSPHRGLLVTAPLLGFGLCALPLLKRRLGTALWLSCLAGSAYFVLIVASSSVWFGGWSFGLRLLIPIYGLLALAAAAGFDALASFPALQVMLRAAAIYALVYQQLVQLGFPELPPEFSSPLPDAILPLYRAGYVAPNLACKLGGLGLWNVLGVMPVSAALIVVLAMSGKGALRSRLAYGLSALLLAAAALSSLARSDISIPPAAQARWVKQVQAWTAAEERCSRR